MRTAGEKFAHYEIRSLLGQGGMGEVYLAFDTKLHRKVALKLLLVSEATGEEAKRDAVARIIREARAAAALEHPNKVSIFELGEVDGTPYLAMEYIAGSTLRAFVGDAEIDWKRKLGWLLDVARALDAAHDAGLVHRDIKPENVMVRKDGIVKVLDFGIARRADSAVDDAGVTTPAIEALTGKGVVIGTAAYMPPEQMQGQDLDGRADQFAWGVMAFELLSGRHPWATNAGQLAMVGAMLTKPAPLLEGFPEVVAAGVARALSQKREDRFASMNEIVSLLAGVVGPSEPMAIISSDGAGASKDDVASAPTDVARARTEAVEKTPAPTPAPVVPDKGRRRRWPIVVGALALAALAASGWRWNATRTRIEYCLNFTMTSSGPRCAVPVPASSMGQRDHTYRLAAGPHGVELVERLNSAGLALSQRHPALRGGDVEEARMEVRRRTDGSVQEIVALDQDGEELRHEVWSEAGGHVDYVEGDGKAPRHLGDSRVTSVRREFDSRGYIRRERYFGVTGKPRPSEEGIFGREVEHAADGFPVRETNLGWDAEPMANERGVATWTNVADARGVAVESRRLDLDGKPAPVDGVWMVRDEYSADLELASVAFFDASGARVATLAYGTHGISKTIDPTGRHIRTTFLDGAAKARQRKGDAYASVDVTLDDRGRYVDVTFLDTSGNPVVTAEDGVAAWRRVWDERDHRVELHALDPSGHAMPSSDGVATRRETSDSRGRRVEVRQFDVDDQLAPSSQASAIVKYTFDDRGLVLTGAHFDAQGHPAYHAEGFSSSRLRYDGIRNKIEHAFLNVDGKPTLNGAGISAERRRFDEDDNLVEVSALDASGGLTFDGSSARDRFEYDDRGFEMQKSLFDTNDNPVLGRSGYAVVRYLRDRSGDITEESYFGKRGEPISQVGGYAKKRNAYDVRRRRVETALLDAKGAPTLGSDGWATERLAYDDRGLIVRETRLDVAGNPVIPKSGGASVTRKYDDRGNLVEVATLGADDKPHATDEGYALKKSAYDQRDQLVEEELFGADGARIVGKNGWAVRKLRYDELGLLVDESFFDAERKPVVAKDPAYARKRDKYDARRRLIESTYFDPAGVPTKGPEGAETVRYVRDAYGHATETTYFDAASAPTASKDGKIVIRSKYDDVGRLIAESYVDADGKPHAAKDGCMGRRTKYDELGRALEEACLDDKAGLRDSADGWASKRFLRDARGLVVDEATYGADWKLRADASGIARKKHRYDDRRLLLETTFWGADDKPAKDAKGAVARRFRYDETGKQIEETSVDDKGAVVTGEAKKKEKTKKVDEE